MPTNRLVAKEEVATYANVLFESAYAEGGQDEVLVVRTQYENILAIMSVNMTLSMDLEKPAYTPKQRYELARSVFATCAEPLREVLAVMSERGNATMIRSVYHSYNLLLEQKLDLVVVDVTTVVELDDHLRELITDKAEKDLGKKVVLRELIDKSILGGIIMSANGKRIDASIRSQLAKARNVLQGISDGGE
ncbi:MAG: ATP synthase F1 subunit delta [Eggerthellaceae bacterium]|nr:ATP synthase F1 subunit delta [Eggerthellaceae bacterium]